MSIYNTHKPPYLLFAVVLLFAGLLLACTVLQAAPQRDRGVGVYFDQDLFIPYVNQDRDYTMGMAIEFFWDKEDGIYPLDGMAGRVGRWMGMGGADDSIVTSFIVGTVNFTPDDLSDPDPIVGDRPYASLLYLGNKRVRASKTSAVAAEALVGVLGTTVAREAQLKLHGWWRSAADSDEPVDPQGWDHQISDGGELTMRMRFSNSRLRAESAGLWDVATTWAVSLGYQTNASLGVSARLGKISSAFWSIPFDPVNRGSFLPSLSDNEWYLWAAYRARLVAYDAMLQGQFRHSDVTISAQEIERLLHEGAVGVTVAVGQALMTFSVNAKSAEFKQSSRRAHYWGGLSLTYHF
jgi:hypothetical protein